VAGPGFEVSGTDGRYSGVDNLEVMRQARNYNAYLLRLITTYAANGARLLDFGAGAGTFAAPLAGRGFDVWCVESDSSLVKQMRDAGLRAESSLASVPRSAFDLVYSLNVLEHIEDDRRIVALLAETLRPGGRLLVYVPAFESLFTSMDRKVGHLRRYTTRTLGRAIAAGGLTVEEMRYADSLGVAATLVYKMFDPGDGRIGERGLKLYDRLVFPISRRLDIVMGRYLGKNVLAVARRPG